MSNVDPTDTVKIIVRGTDEKDGCWDFYVDGKCGSEPLEFEMEYNASISLWEQIIYPDNIYPEIYFVDSDVTWENEPLETRIRRSNYHLFHFNNSFVMVPNMSFWIELNVVPDNPNNPAPLMVYLVGEGQNASYFEGSEDWREKDETSFVGSILRTQPFHHTHTVNSSHHLIPLSTDSDGKINGLEISSDFWIILYQDGVPNNRTWKLRYHTEQVYDSSEWKAWYTAELGSGNIWTTPVFQGGSPDVHIHIARRESTIDQVSVDINATNPFGSDQGNSPYIFTFAPLPNLPPSPTIFTSPDPETFPYYSGEINIAWLEATDPNNDPLTYTVVLFGDEIAEPIQLYTGPGLSFDWNSTVVPDGIYDLNLTVCDPEPLCVTTKLSDQYNVSFVILNNPGELEVVLTANPETVLVNDTIDVNMTVTNTGGETLTGVLPSLLTITGTGDATLSSGPDPVTHEIPVGESRTFKWVYSASEAGNIRFEGNATGSGALSGLVESSTQESNEVEILVPGVLTSFISAEPLTVTPGQTITVEMEVENTGGEQVNNVSPSSLAINNPALVSLTSPDPASQDIPAGESRTFTWTYDAVSAGTVNFTGNAEGTGSQSGDTFTSSLTTSNNVIILGGLALTSEIFATPASVELEDIITVAMTVRNIGGENAIDVNPSQLILNNPGLASILEGPDPVTHEIPAGQSRIFIWKYKSNLPGIVNFTGSVTGIGEQSGNTVSSIATSNAVRIIQRDKPLPENILFPSLRLVELEIDGAGEIIIVDETEFHLIELSPGENTIVAKVQNPGFFTQIDVKIEFEGLPQGISVIIEGQNQEFKANSFGEYIVTINIPPEIPSGEYNIRIRTSARRGSASRSDVKLIIS